MLVAVANEPAASRAEAIPIHDRRADHVLATLPQNGHLMHFSLGGEILGRVCLRCASSAVGGA